MSTTISPTAAAQQHLGRVLRAAAARIRRDGWRADNPADYTPHTELTADEAIELAARDTFTRATGTIPVYSSDRDDLITAGLSVFAGWLILTGQHDARWDEFHGRTIVSQWNDDPGRTRTQVLAALNQAADVLEVVSALGSLEGGEAA